jgi:transcriptional regulator with XRE-family HTH domain
MPDAAVTTPRTPRQWAAAFGATLRAARRRRGLTLAALGAQTGLDRGALSRIETGQRQITVHQYLRLHRVLGAAALPLPRWEGS